MVTRGIGKVATLGLGLLSAGLIGTGLWGLGQPDHMLLRTVCSESHCVQAAGLYQAALLVGTLLLAVVLLAASGRETVRRDDRPPAPHARGAPVAHRRG